MRGVKQWHIMGESKRKFREPRFVSDNQAVLWARLGVGNLTGISMGGNSVRREQMRL